jgi:hypothetical protein
MALCFKTSNHFLVDPPCFLIFLVDPPCLGRPCHLPGILKMKNIFKKSLKFGVEDGPTRTCGFSTLVSKPTSAGPVRTSSASSGDLLQRLARRVSLEAREWWMARKSKGFHQKNGVDQHKQGFLSDLSCFSIDLSPPSQQFEHFEPVNRLLILQPSRKVVCQPQWLGRLVSWTVDFCVFGRFGATRG